MPIFLHVTCTLWCMFDRDAVHVIIMDNVYEWSSTFKDLPDYVHVYVHMSVVTIRGQKRESDLLGPVVTGHYETLSMDAWNFHLSRPESEFQICENCQSAHLTVRAKTMGLTLVKIQK